MPRKPVQPAAVILPVCLGGAALEAPPLLVPQCTNQPTADIAAATPPRLPPKQRQLSRDNSKDNAKPPPSPSSISLGLAVGYR